MVVQLALPRPRIRSAPAEPDVANGMPA